jgi:hypothetical protein
MFGNCKPSMSAHPNCHVGAALLILIEIAIAIGMTMRGNEIVCLKLMRRSPLLVPHFKALSLPEGGRVFLPLCGKTLDIHWLLTGGYRVSGAELRKIAIE